MTDQTFTAVGGYVFAGGFTLGMQEAGFDVTAHLEDGAYGVPTARRNFPDLPIFVGSDQWPLESLEDDPPDVVFGNPPCAAWSGLNGKKTSTGTWKDDDRINCTLKHFTLLEQLRPKVWVWESVERAWSTGREFVEDLVDRAVDLGYSVDLVLFDAQYIGGNHRRRRFFFVATRIDIDWFAEGFSDPPTAGELLARVDDPGWYRELTPFYQHAWEHTGFNQNLRDGWERANPIEERQYRTTTTGKTFTIGRPAFKYRMLDPDGVAPTVVGASLIHPHERRFVSIQEAKEICGYPLDFELEKNGTDAYDLLTRGVMPPVGAWFGRRVREALARDEAPHPRLRVRLLDGRNPEKVRVVELERQEDWVGDGAPRWLEPKPVKPPRVGGKPVPSGPRKPKRRTVDLDEVTAPTDVPTPEETGDTKSGAYIQRLLRGNLDESWRLADEQIARLVLDHFEGRKTTTSDVAYQRAQLRQRIGVDVPRIFYDELESDHAEA